MFSSVFPGCSSAPDGVAGPQAVSPLPGVMPGRVLVSDRRLALPAAYGSSASCGGLPPAGAPGAVTASNPPVPVWAATGERAASTLSASTLSASTLSASTRSEGHARQPVMPGSGTMANFRINSRGRLSPVPLKDRSRRIPARRHPASAPNAPRRKPFPCPVEGCESRYGDRPTLAGHIRSHTGEKPYACPFHGCGWRFALKANRNAHLKVHFAYKPYVCPFEGCAHRCKRESNLRAHIVIHTGKKPYPCLFEGCSKRFRERMTRRQHMNAHAGRKPYQCPHADCGRSFAYIASLQCHLRSRVHSPGPREAKPSTTGQGRLSGHRPSAGSLMASSSSPYRPFPAVPDETVRWLALQNASLQSGGQSPAPLFDIRQPFAQWLEPPSCAVGAPDQMAAPGAGARSGYRLCHPKPAGMHRCVGSGLAATGTLAPTAVNQPAGLPSSGTGRIRGR